MFCPFVLLPFVPFSFAARRAARDAQMPEDELLVIDRRHQLLKWFLGRLAKFPRSHRDRLGQQIETE